MLGIDGTSFSILYKIRKNLAATVFNGGWKFWRDALSEISEHFHLSCTDYL